LTGRIPIAFTVLCVLVAGLGLVAKAAAPAVPITGLSGPNIEAAGALRTNDGGAILVVRIADAPGSARGRMITSRLLADGALSLAYGTDGTSTLPVDTRLRPTAVAIDPRTGDTWVGARIGDTGTGEIIAVDGNGHRRTRFGTGGVLHLPPADAGGPVALAWSPRALLIAAGRAPCRGCAISLRDPGTGRRIAAAQLSIAQLSPTACYAAAVASAVFLNADTEAVTTSTGAGRGCATSTLALDRNLVLAGSNGPPPPALTSDPAATTSVIAASGTSGCIAGIDPTGIAISSYAPGSTSMSATAPAGKLVALVPIASGSCAALIKTSRRGGTVAQMSAGNRHALTNKLAASIAPLAMFRCHRHLLVIGARRAQGQETGVIVPIPVRRGMAAADAVRMPPRRERAVCA
jgi:hypothetical protein